MHRTSRVVAGALIALLAPAAPAQDSTPGDAAREDVETRSAAPRPSEPAGRSDRDAPAATDLPERARDWDALLDAHVRDGEVDYAALFADPAPLERTLADFAAVDPEALSRDETLAFWVNAYNAFTLRLILDHWAPEGGAGDGPTLESIKDIPSGRRWKAERWRVGGRRYSLDRIEHDILRPMGDPRVHFVLVCASRSCPDLASEALVAARLDAQLDAAARRFLADPTKGLTYASEPGALWGTNHVLRLSKIFDWFDDDFGDGERELVDFVLRYAPPEAAAWIREHRDDLDVEHLDYDWSLNDRRS